MTDKISKKQVIMDLFLLTLLSLSIGLVLNIGYTISSLERYKIRVEVSDLSSCCRCDVELQNGFNVTIRNQSIFILGCDLQKNHTYNIKLEAYHFWADDRSGYAELVFLLNITFTNETMFITQLPILYFPFTFTIKDFSIDKTIFEMIIK